MISASDPPFRNKWYTAKDMGPSLHSPPKMRSYAAKLQMRTGLSASVDTGPRRARPTNAVIDVATPVIVRAPLGTSSTYMPGYVGAFAIAAVLR